LLAAAVENAARTVGIYKSGGGSHYTASECLSQYSFFVVVNAKIKEHF
jgi:hypothetical protein